MNDHLLKTILDCTYWSALISPKAKESHCKLSHASRLSGSADSAENSETTNQEEDEFGIIRKRGNCIIAAGVKGVGDTKGKFAWSVHQLFNHDTLLAAS